MNETRFCTIEQNEQFLSADMVQTSGIVVVRTNAERMIALRLNRANRQWDIYWNQVRKPD